MCAEHEEASRKKDFKARELACELPTCDAACRQRRQEFVEKSLSSK